jgi:hypothetical protein
MPFLRNITSGLRSLFQKEQVDRELDEELRAYQEMVSGHAELVIASFQGRYGASPRLVSESGLPGVSELPNPERTKRLRSIQPHATVAPSYEIN